jgi:hypothetical protein
MTAILPYEMQTNSHLQGGMTMANRERSELIRFFVTKEEKEFIKYKMSLMNVTNMSAYLRKMAIDGMLVQVDYSQFDKIANDLDGVSRNINQIAKRINSTETIYAGDMRQILEKQEEIWQLLKSIESQLP